MKTKQNQEENKLKKDERIETPIMVSKQLLLFGWIVTKQNEKREKKDKKKRES